MDLSEGTLHRPIIGLVCDTGQCVHRSTHLGHTHTHTMPACCCTAGIFLKVWSDLWDLPVYSRIHQCNNVWHTVCFGVCKVTWWALLWQAGICGEFVGRWSSIPLGLLLQKSMSIYCTLECPEDQIGPLGKPLTTSFLAAAWWGTHLPCGIIVRTTSKKGRWSALHI